MRSNIVVKMKKENSKHLVGWKAADAHHVALGRIFNGLDDSEPLLEAHLFDHICAD